MHDANEPADAATGNALDGSPTETRPSADEQAVRRDFATQVIPLLKQSVAYDLGALPFPIPFRNRGVMDDWRQVLNKITVDQWTLWQDCAQPDFTCGDFMSFFEELFRYLMYPENPQGVFRRETDAASVAMELSANLLYARRGGAMIEVTPALETLLRHSDVDATLPMGMVVPPFAAQYLRFSEDVGRELNPFADEPEQSVDGVFCFVSPHRTADGSPSQERILQFVFVLKQHGRRSCLFKVERPVVSEQAGLAEWMMQMRIDDRTGAKQPMDPRIVELVGYVAKVFLYLGLKDARRVVVRDYGDAKKRVKKQPKLAHKIPSLYDRIVVGPASLPDAAPASGNGHAMPPHWRRGHFRMHAHGPGYSERKLIFIAPVLVHADRLAEEKKKRRNRRPIAPGDEIVGTTGWVVRHNAERAHLFSKLNLLSILSGRPEKRIKQKGKQTMYDGNTMQGMNYDPNNLIHPNQGPCKS